MIEFTPRQGKTVAAGLTVLSAAVVLTFAIFIGWVVLRFVTFASVALVPVVLGVFLAMLFQPYYAWFVRHVRNPTLALVMMFVSLLVPVGCLIAMGGLCVVTQFVHLAGSLPTVVTRLSAWTSQQFPQLQGTLAAAGLSPEQQLFFTDPTQFTREVFAQLSAAYGAEAVRAGMGVLKYLSGAGTALVTLIFFAFFVTRPPVRGAELVRQMPFLKEQTQKFVSAQIDLFGDIVVSFFQRQVIICLIEGLLYGIGFACVGVPYGFILGFMLGGLNLVPLLGTVLILPLALPLAYFGDGGGTWHLVGALIVWLTGQVLDGYLITPKIQGEKTGLGYAGVIFSFFFWGVVFQSLLGLLLAIPLSAFCVVLWRALRDKYIRGVI